MSDFILLNSFDRSGSSMLAKLSSKHPDVECLFQPFNSSVFRRHLFDYWDSTTNNIEATKLVDSILKGIWTRDVIKSHWFFTHSTSTQLDVKKTYIIKTTNFHFKHRWLTANFPQIKQFALIRNPRSILASFIRNDLIREWYSPEMMENCFQSYAQMSESGLSRATMVRSLSKNNIALKMTGVISMMMDVMISDIPPENIVRYEDLLVDANQVLYSLLLAGLPHSVNFADNLDEDYNIVGKSPASRRPLKSLVTDSDSESIERIISCFPQLYSRYSTEEL